MKILLSIYLIILFLLISCESNPVSTTAELIDIVKLSKTPGYQWYDLEVQNYNPDINIVNEVKNVYNSSKHKFVIMVKPSCSCPGTQKQFPAIMKTFNLAGITQSNYLIYSVSSERTKHPYEKHFKINELPSIILMQDSLPVYSIADTFYIQRNLGSNKPLEYYLLEALKK